MNIIKTYYDVREINIYDVFFLRRIRYIRLRGGLVSNVEFMCSLEICVTVTYMPLVLGYKVVGAGARDCLVKLEKDHLRKRTTERLLLVFYLKMTAVFHLILSNLDL